MKKKLIIIPIIMVIVFIIGFFVIKFIFQSYYGFGPCRIWKPIHTSDYQATSSEDARNMVVDFFYSKNLNFNNDDINVEKIKKYYIFTDYYEVTYHICGTREDIKNVPTGQAASFSGGTPTCSNIPFKVKGNQIIGQFINPC